MKKRKTPVLLLSLLVLLVGGVIFLNRPPDDGKATADSDEKVTTPQDAPTPDAVHSQALKSVAIQPMAKIKGKSVTPNQGPTVAIDSSPPILPKPTPSGPTTSSHWYDK
ncbi:MAG: hypothetical protein ACHQ50_05950 [Fimbriimonadales bacterium]